VKDIEWVLERNAANRAAASAGRNANRKKKDQRTAWVAIFNAFKDHLPSYVQDVDKTQAEFATDAWIKIYEKYRPSDLAAATDLIADLEDAIIFNGEIEEYVKKIKHLKERLAALGHPQDELLICRNIYNSILAYSSTTHDSMEAQWGNWIMTLKMNAPNRTLSLNLIETQGKEYNRHLTSAKKDAKKYQKTSTGGLANFNAYHAGEGKPKCSYCGGPHRFPDGCDKAKYDQRKREESRGRSRERDFNRSRSQDRNGSRGAGRGGSRPRSTSRGRSGSRGRTKACYSCGDPFHLSPDCPYRDKIKDFVESLKRQKTGSHGAYNATDRLRFSDRTRDSSRDRSRSRNRSRSRDRYREDKKRSLSRDRPERKPAALIALSEWSKQQNFVPMSASFKPYAGVHVTSSLGKRRLREDDNMPTLNFQDLDDANAINCDITKWNTDNDDCDDDVPILDCDDSDDESLGEAPCDDGRQSYNAHLAALPSRTLSIRPLVWEDGNGFNIDEQFSDAASIPFWNYSPNREAITHPAFPSRPCARALAAYKASGKRSQRPNSFNKARADDEHWMIVDSGCNNHYIARSDFLYRTENIDTKVTGIGDNTVHATKKGIFAGVLTDDRGDSVDFESWALYMPQSTVSLFSVVQAAFGDNHVIHEGHPVRGRHGLWIPQTNQFIPFTFCEESGLFWVPVHRRAQEPVTFLNTAPRV